MSQNLRIALTKGRLQDKAVSLFEAMGLDCTPIKNPGRRLIHTIPNYPLDGVLAKAPDVITYVEHGVCDLGIAGKDTILEQGGAFYEVLDLGFGKCRLALAVKEGSETAPKILALKAALESQQVASFIESKYSGSVVSTVDHPGTGYDDSVDYEALKGQTITVAASPTPHAEILEVVKEILAAKGITLDIQVYNDYVVPNTVVDDGTVDANYFQHLPYLEDFNAENNTHIVSVSAIHVEPMGLYGGRQTSLDALKASK